MAEQRTRSAKQAVDNPGGSGTATAVASMSTPIFDELLREMAAQRSKPETGKPVESKHRAN